MDIQPFQTDNYVIYPSDFHGVVPKMLLKEGETVLQGQPIFYSKANPEIKFVSPVSGTLTKIERGAKGVSWPYPLPLTVNIKLSFTS